MATPEGAILKQILDYLVTKHVLAFRMNTGAMQSEHNGKKRFMRFGTPGMADILAFIPRDGWWYSEDMPSILKPGLMQEVTWIECKAPKGRQSELQKSFQAQVEAEGHKYILAFSSDDLEEL
jgi:hypothetical protein